MPVAQLPELQFYGNPVRAWLAALIVLVAVLGVLVVARLVLIRRLAKLAGRTETRLDDLALDLLQRTSALFLVALALAASTLALALTERAGTEVRTALVVVFLLQAAVWGNGLVAFWVQGWSERRAADASSRMTIAAMGYAARFVLWSIILLLVLDNLGYNVTALVTTLGVGGVAVALAVQNILGDLFAALSIIVDKPFVVGDSIDAGSDYAGTVERIGLKSTRIRALSGELIVISNGDLLKSRVRNYRGQMLRRVVFPLAVDYDTPQAVVARVPGLVRDVIERHHAVRFDRAHFKAFGDSALLFEVVYVMTDPDYGRYMDTQQAINLEIMRRFEENGIAFAHPVRTVLLRDARDDGRAGTGGAPRAATAAPDGAPPPIEEDT